MLLPGQATAPFWQSCRPGLLPVSPLFGETYSHCLNTVNGVTSPLLGRDKIAVSQLDAEFKDAYKRLMTGLPEVRKPLLRPARHDWLTFRRDDYTFVALPKKVVATHHWWRTAAVRADP